MERSLVIIDLTVLWFDFNFNFRVPTRDRKFRESSLNMSINEEDSQWRSQDLAQGEGKSLSVITDKKQELWKKI